MDQPIVPQQPNLEVIQQGLQMVANEVPLLNNHPAVNQMGAFQQMFDAMEDRINQRLNLQERRITRRMHQRINLHVQRIMERMDQQERRINRRMNRRMTLQEQRIMGRMDMQHQISHARSLNSSALLDTVLLNPIALPDGNIPADFPRTIAAFRALTGPQLSAWIQQYDIVPAGGIPFHLDERRQVLARHCSIRL